MSTNASSGIHDLDAAFARARRHPRLLGAATATAPADHDRLMANFAVVEAEIDAPRPGPLARLLMRCGVHEDTVPLITATPALRRSWIIAVTLAVLFALSAAGNSTAEGADRIVVFLTLAPLVPLAGVALAFGPGVDPTHEIAVAAPIDGFRLFLIRSLTVVASSSALLLVASALVPQGGAHRIAWLLPALAGTTLTMALSTRFDPRAAAAVVAVGWVALVTVTVAASDAGTVFGAALQIPSLIVACLGAAVFAAQRRRLDTLTTR